MMVLIITRLQHIEKTKVYVGQVGLVLAVAAFFYLFALIILSGAEVNAFYEEGVHTPSSDLIARSIRNS